MKMLTMLSILMMVFTSCGTLTPSETQQERERLLAAYDAARQKHNPERIKKAVKDLLVGKWQYVGLEVEADNIAAQKAKPTSQQTDNLLDAYPEGLSDDPLVEQAETPNAPSPEVDEQASEEDTTRLPRIEVTDERSDQQMLAAKAALVASTRQSLTLEFFEDRSSYYYNSNNRGASATGQCYITTKRYGDDPFPFISFNRRTGPEMIEFLFGSEPVKRMSARERQKMIAMKRDITPISGASRNKHLTGPPMRRAPRKQTSFLMAGITVTEDRLYLVLYGDVELTPKGWVRTGGLRCIFKRIE